MVGIFNKNVISDNRLTGSLKVTGSIVGVFWIIEAINLLTGHSLNVLGILPLDAFGLLGIMFSPFLHGGLGHLISNTVPFLIMGTAIAVKHGIGGFTKVSLFVGGVGGFLVWLLAGFLGGASYHIGASGVVFGYFGFLLARGIATRDPLDIFLSVAVFAFYGGLIVGVFPTVPWVSWQGHLFGFLAGITAAFLFKHEKGQ